MQILPMSFMTISHRKNKRKRRPQSTREFIQIRIDQLKEDRERANDPHDRLWYDRLIDELEYVRLYDQTKHQDKGTINQSRMVFETGYRCFGTAGMADNCDACDSYNTPRLRGSVWV